MKKALITGITGQDGAYLAEFLLEKGYQVHGIKRRASSFNTDRVDHLYQDPHEAGQRFFLHYGDLTDTSNLVRILQQVKPDEIYNLGAQSHVQVSFEVPEYTAQTDAVGTLRLLEDLSGLHVGTLRKGPGDSAKGKHSLLSPESLRLREALLLLDCCELPGILRVIRLQRNPVQS